MMQPTNQKIKHIVLEDWTNSGSHTVFLLQEISLHGYLLANPVLNFVVAIIIIMTKIHSPKGRHI